MSQRLGLMFAIVLLAAGIGLFLIVRGSSEQRQETCAEYCNKLGKDFVSASAGTVGRSIEGGTNWLEPTHECICVTKKAPKIGKGPSRETVGDV